MTRTPWTVPLAQLLAETRATTDGSQRELDEGVRERLSAQFEALGEDGYRLRRSVGLTASVLRDGQDQEVPVEDLVPGECLDGVLSSHLS